MKKNTYFLYALVVILAVTAACWASAFDSAGSHGSSSWRSGSSTSHASYGGGFSGGHK